MLGDLRRIRVNLLIGVSTTNRCSSRAEAKRTPAEKIIIFACDTTDVAEGREVNIKRWEI